MWLLCYRVGIGVLSLLGCIAAWLDAAYCYRRNIAWTVGLTVTIVHEMNPAKAAEPIVMSFGLWIRVGRRNHVLDEVQIPRREWAILTFEGEKGLSQYML